MDREQEVLLTKEGGWGDVILIESFDDAVFHIFNYLLSGIKIVRKAA